MADTWISRFRRHPFLAIILIALVVIAVSFVAFRLRPNTAPIISETAVAIRLEVNVTGVFAGDDVTLIAQFEDPDGDDYLVTWDFGNGRTGEGVEAETGWDNPGRYLVVYTVDDRRGGVASNSADPFPVEAAATEPPDPVANKTFNNVSHAALTIEQNPALVGLEVAFDGSASGAWVWDRSSSWDLDANVSRIVSWTWNFGDGETATFEDSAGAMVTHAYDSPGLYSVTLRVTDDGGTIAFAGGTVHVIAS